MNNEKKKETFGKILEKYQYILSNGDIVAGKIIHEEKKGFLVDIGTKTAGYLPKEEVAINLKKQNNEHLLLLSTTRDFFLITHNLNSQQYIISIKRLDYIRAWKRIKQIYLEDIVFNLRIQYVNRGGIITSLEGIQGFIPKSHISVINEEINLTKNMHIKCKFLTTNENKNQLILSNKSANLALSKHKFKLGELVYGKIMMLKSYGLFINIYNIKALLHVSEMGSINLNKINTIFKIGSFIKIKVIHLNTKQGQVSVSFKNIK